MVAVVMSGRWEGGLGDRPHCTFPRVSFPFQVCSLSLEGPSDRVEGNDSLKALIWENLAIVTFERRNYRFILRKQQNSPLGTHWMEWGWGGGGDNQNWVPGRPGVDS